MRETNDLPSRDRPEFHRRRMRHCMHKMMLTAGLMFAVITLSGCAMFNPYVTPDSAACPTNTSKMDIADAVACALGPRAVAGRLAAEDVFAADLELLLARLLLGFVVLVVLHVLVVQPREHLMGPSVRP